MNNQESIINAQDIVQYIVQNEVRKMLAVNYSTIRNNLKDYCDKVVEQDETVIVTRKGDKNVVIMSLERYNNLEKIIRNAEYLNKIDEGIAQIKAGKGQIHELVEVDDE